MMKTSVRFSIVLFILIIMPLIFACENQKVENNLTVVSFGGAYQKAQKVAYMLPFEKKTGIKITEGEYNGDYGVLRTRALSPQGTWDVVSVEEALTIRGTKEGLFLPLPKATFSEPKLIKPAILSHAAGHLVFSTILAYNEKAFSALSEKPTTWMDFWNVKKYKGKRGLRNNPRGTLEIALLADGVSRESLYPLDVDRAFKSLDKIRDYIVFWESGAQPVQLLANNVVSMSSAYNGRVWDAKTNEKLPISWSLDGGLMEVEYWCVPKNAPNPEAAFDFIKYSLRPDRQAAFARTIAYGPTNSAALPMIPESILSALPSSLEALPKQVPVDGEWWAQNQAMVAARWEKWIAKH